MPTEHAHADAHSDATGHAPTALTATQRQIIERLQEARREGLESAAAFYDGLIMTVERDYRKAMVAAGLEAYIEQTANADTRAQEDAT